MVPMIKSDAIKNEDVDTIFVNWKDLISCNNTFLRYFFFNFAIHPSSTSSLSCGSMRTTRALRIRKKMSLNGMVQVIGDILVDHVIRSASN